MYKGLIEINPGFITWYKLSLSSTSIEILGSKEIKIKKILNFPYSDKDLYFYGNIVNFAKSELKNLGCSEINVISVYNFPAMFIARLSEKYNIHRISDNSWRQIVSGYVKTNLLCLWFEKSYAKISWESKGYKFVQSLQIDYEDTALTINLIRTISKTFALYDIQRNINEIKIGGQFESSDEDFISAVILVLTRLFPYAEISYDLPSFIEIYTGLRFKSYY